MALFFLIFFWFWFASVVSSREWEIVCRLGASPSGNPPQAVLGFLPLYCYRTIGLLPRNMGFTWQNRKVNAVNDTLSWKSHSTDPSTLPCFLVSSLVIFNQASSPRGHYTLPVSECDRTLEDNMGWKPLTWSSLVDRIDYKPWLWYTSDAAYE